MAAISPRGFGSKLDGCSSAPLTRRPTCQVEALGADWSRRSATCHASAKAEKARAQSACLGQPALDGARATFQGASMRATAGWFRRERAAFCGAGPAGLNRFRRPAGIGRGGRPSSPSLRSWPRCHVAFARQFPEFDRFVHVTHRHTIPGGTQGNSIDPASLAVKYFSRIKSRNAPHFANSVLASYCSKRTVSTE